MATVIWQLNMSSWHSMRWPWSLWSFLLADDDCTHPDFIASKMGADFDPADFGSSVQHSPGAWWCWLLATLAYSAENGSAGGLLPDMISLANQPHFFSSIFVWDFRESFVEIKQFNTEYSISTQFYCFVWVFCFFFSNQSNFSEYIRNLIV